MRLIIMILVLFLTEFTFSQEIKIKFNFDEANCFGYPTGYIADCDTANYYISFEERFHHDTVRVEQNGIVVFDSVISTTGSLGIAGFINLGKCTLKNDLNIKINSQMDVVLPLIEGKKYLRIQYLNFIDEIYFEVCYSRFKPKFY